jgi:hypothetical protein
MPGMNKEMAIGAMILNIATLFLYVSVMPIRKYMTTLHPMTGRADGMNEHPTAHSHATNRRPGDAMRQRNM